MIKAFKRPGTLGDDATRVALAVEDYSRQLTLNPLLGGRLLQRLTVSTTPATFQHGLNRAWQGWIVTRNSGNVVVYEGTQGDATKTITLVGSGSATIDIYVF